MDSQNTIKIGIGVMTFKNGKVLMGKRNGRHGEGEYAFTGGNLDYTESFENCARRETREEAGIEIKNIKFYVFLTKRCTHQDMMY